eukprot:scaffold136527_cov19-Tisochrysis_lutea.AAC.1
MLSANTPSNLQTMLYRSRALLLKDDSSIVLNSAEELANLAQGNLHVGTPVYKSTYTERKDQITQPKSGRVH